MSGDPQNDARDDAPRLWARDEPDSPCVSLCMVHPIARICAGCGRTPEEIAAWPTLDPADRAAVRAALPERLAGLADPALRPSRRRVKRR